MHKQLLLLLVLPLAAACSSVPFFGEQDEAVNPDTAESLPPTGALFEESDPDPAPPAFVDILNFTMLDGKVAGGGMISAEQVATLPALGYTTIINLRSEQDEGVPAEIAAAAAAGITYISVPVTKHDFTLADAHAVAMALERNPGHVLFHCRTGGRVSAVWALTRAINEGLSPEEAQQVAAEEGCRPIPQFMVDRVGSELRP
jgi:uncharacterized protein (TIGR01244 family)